MSWRTVFDSNAGFGGLCIAQLKSDVWPSLMRLAPFELEFFSERVIANKNIHQWSVRRISILNLWGKHALILNTQQGCQANPRTPDMGVASNIYRCKSATVDPFVYLMNIYCPTMAFGENSM